MVNKSPITSRWSTKAPSSEDGQQKLHRLQMVNKSSIASRWSTKAPSPPDGQQKLHRLQMVNKVPSPPDGYYFSGKWYLKRIVPPRELKAKPRIDQNPWQMELKRILPVH